MYDGVAIIFYVEICYVDFIFLLMLTLKCLPCTEELNSELKQGQDAGLDHMAEQQEAEEDHPGRVRIFNALELQAEASTMKFHVLKLIQVMKLHLIM